MHDDFLPDNVIPKTTDSLRNVPKKAKVNFYAQKKLPIQFSINNQQYCNETKLRELFIILKKNIISIV